MVTDIRTLVLIIGLSHLMQVIVFYHQYRVNKFVKGPGWWLLWSAAETLGFTLILMRFNPALLPFAIVFQDPLLVLGTIFIYIGVLRFFDLKVHFKTITAGFLSFVVLHLFFYCFLDKIEIRSILLCLYLAIISYMTVLSLHKHKTKAIASTTNFNAIVLLVHGSIFTYRGIMISFGHNMNAMLEPTFMNQIQYFDALIVSLLWTFGFIIMLNQRLNSEINEAKEHFEQIFATSPDAVAITRLEDGVYADCNDSFLRISGYTKQELVGRSSIEVNIWYDPADRYEMAGLVKEKGYCENFEAQFVRKGGEIFTGLMSAKTMTLHGCPHIISITRDISERKRAENALRESEEKFRAIANYAASWEAWFSQEGKLLWMNPYSVNITGYTPEEYLAAEDYLSTVLAEEDREEGREKFQTALKGSSGDNLELRCLRKDGTKFWASVSWRPLLDSAGNSVGFRTSTQDISKRKEMENALRESEQQLQFVLQGSQLGFWDWNIVTNEVKRNERWAEMLGYDPIEIEYTVKQWAEFIHPDDQAKAWQSVQDHIHGLTPMHKFEYRMLAKNGEYRWILDQAKVVTWDTAGKALRMSGTHTDITEQKRVEQEIILKNQQLIEANSEKDKFFSIIGHDLKSPFLGFLGLTQLMAEEAGGYSAPELSKLGVEMHQTASNLFRLLKNLLEWAQMQRGSISFQPKPVLLSDLIAENIETLKKRSEQKGIVIQYSPSSPVDVFADEKMIGSVLLNLLSNAVKFTDRDGKITVAVNEISNNFIEVSVSDTGIGINKSDADKLFKAGEKVKMRGTDGELGTGLGLILCKEFVEKHNGRIWVESEEGRGSTFRFTLLKKIPS